jgi:hypothetical protein
MTVSTETTTDPTFDEGRVTTQELSRRGLSPAGICRRRGWRAGTRIVGDEGYGPSVIRITAVGERRILAVTESRNGKPTNDPFEASWVLDCRDWTEVPA